MKTTYRRLEDGTAIIVHQAMGDRFRLFRAHFGQRLTRRELKRRARLHGVFHCYPAPAWAVYL
jgi:hypothetical protein